MSDIDVDLVVAGELPAAEELRRIGTGGRSKIAPVWFTWDSAARLGSAGGLELVSAQILHRDAVVLRGPHPSRVVPPVDRDGLVRAMLENVESYWVPWLERARRDPIRRLMTLHPRLVEWGVLGVPRLYVTVVEGEVVSKSAAGLYVRERFDDAWHRILDEALRLREGVGGRRYVLPIERRRDMLAFAGHAIEQTRGAARSAVATTTADASR